MHDLDRTVMEYAAQSGTPEISEYEEEGFPREGFEFEEYEFLGDHAEPRQAEAEGVLTEQEELELTMEALGVTNEAELEYFLGNLISKVGKGIKSFAPGVLKTLGGALRGLGKTVLPIAATAAGTFFGGPAGGALGASLGSALSKSMEAELSGLSQEDREFEQARQFVRFASDAAQELEKMSRHGYPHRMHHRRAVHHALVRALRRRRIPVAPPQIYDDADGSQDPVYVDAPDDDTGEAEFTPLRPPLRAPAPARAPGAPVSRPHAPVPPRPVPKSPTPGAPILPPRAPVHAGSVPAPRPPVLAQPNGHPAPPSFAPVHGKRGYWVRRGPNIHIYGV